MQHVYLNILTSLKDRICNGDEQIFDGFECSFYVENLKFVLFCNTFICKFKFFCSPRLKSDLLKHVGWNLLD